MSRAIRATLNHLLVLLGCVHVTCGPLGFLQLIAWATMLAGYSIEDGLTRGLTDTFSGARPCAMCLKIAAADQNQEQPPEAPNPERTASAPHPPQPWQIPPSLHLATPCSRDPAQSLAGTRRDEVMTSAPRFGPEPPPPRSRHFPS